MRTSDIIHSDIQRRFEVNTQKRIQEGSVMDFFTVATAETLGDVYQEIENNKMPHIYSGLKGENIDDLGYFVNCPREPEETDENYLYRIMNWILRNEASNTTAIQDSLLNLEHASSADYIPLTNGCGTATVFIIPKNYEEETIQKAIYEVEKRIEKVSSPSLYIEYVVPTIVPVRLHLHIESRQGDIELIRANIFERTKDYINSVPPKQRLHIGMINRIGVNEPAVDYFSVLQIFINNKETKDIEILQGLETKMILDEIIWS